MAQSSVIQISDTAAQHIQNLMEQGGEDAKGLRIGVKARGCSGMMYYMEYASEEQQGDELVEDKGVRVYVDSASLLHLLGTEIDYVSNDLEEGFVFNNPNETGRCGCGESFKT